MKAATARKVARNLIYLSIGQVASTILGVILTAVLGRALEPVQFGILYTVIAITAFASVFIDWGQGTYLVREMARGRADEPRLIGSALLFRVLATVAVTIATFIMASALGYSGDVIQLSLISLIFGLPQALLVPFSCSFRSRDRMDIDVSVGLLGKCVLLIATIVALQAGGLTEVIIAQSLGGLTALIAGFFAAQRLKLAVAIPDKVVLRELANNGAALAAFALVLATQPFLEVLVLAALAGPAVVGWYGASRTMLGVVISPAMIALSATFPQLSRASRSLPELRQMLDVTARVIFIASALTASGLYVFSDTLVTIIYGHGRFDQTAAILRVNAFFVPLFFSVLLMGTVMTAVGRNKAMVCISILRIVISISVSYFVVDYWQRHYGNGAIALVIVSGLAEIFAAIACLKLLPQGAIGSATILNFFRACITAVLTAAPLSMLQPMGLGYLAPLYVVFFAAAAFATRLVVTNDLSLAMDLVRGRHATSKSPLDDEQNK